VLYGRLCAPWEAKLEKVSTASRRPRRCRSVKAALKASGREKRERSVMASPEAMVNMAENAILQARAVVEEYGSAERVERSGAYFPGMPLPSNVEQFAAYQSELIAGLAEIVGELAEASKAGPRGRPSQSK